MRRCAYCLENLSICMNYETEVITLSYVLIILEIRLLVVVVKLTLVCLLLSTGTRPGQETLRTSLCETELSFFKNLERISRND